MRLIGAAAVNIRAKQSAVDTIANNIANVNTPGFKASKVNFTQTLSVATNFEQGTLVASDNPLDMGIDGSGFFQVKTPDGEMGYTRVGDFQVDVSGRLADMFGNFVEPSIIIEPETTEIVVASNGEIRGTIDGEHKALGQIPLVVFQNPEGLERHENNIFTPTVNSGLPQVGQAGKKLGNQVLGTIRGQFLEQSNVDLAVALTDLIQAQRAYQRSASLVKDGDKMWDIANSLRR